MSEVYHTNSALIGYTGFVGGNLLRQARFDDLYNSSNIENIHGKSYDLLVVAGAPAAKWKANKDPQQDLENIQRLMRCLGKTSAGVVILISTVDVYPIPIEVDEDTIIDQNTGSTYGKHRLMLERYIQSQFDNITIRLPGLFGYGLKKNIVYDILNNNCLDMICPDSIYQFYHLDNLSSDIEVTRTHGINLINFATEGISVREVACEAFGFEFTNPCQTNAVRYDFRTKYDHVFGGSHGYMYGKKNVLAALKDYVSQMGYGRP